MIGVIKGDGRSFDCGSYEVYCNSSGAFSLALKAICLGSALLPP